MHVLNDFDLFEISNAWLGEIIFINILRLYEHVFLKHLDSHGYYLFSNIFDD